MDEYDGPNYLQPLFETAKPGEAVRAVKWRHRIQMEVAWQKAWFLHHIDKNPAPTFCGLAFFLLVMRKAIKTYG